VPGQGLGGRRASILVQGGASGVLAVISLF
jgi:hypothetical protein